MTVFDFNVACLIIILYCIVSGWVDEFKLWRMNKEYAARKLRGIL